MVRRRLIHPNEGSDWREGKFAPRSKVIALRYQENRTVTPPAIGEVVKLL
ncbi:hypothetical protein [Methylocystis rosea]|nr:hypothetical protein [Methylocystis rosea]